MIKNLLDDWPDAEAETLMRRLAEAIRPSGRVVIVGGISPDDEEEGEDTALLMMVLVGGRHRGLTAFYRLARGAGLEVSTAGRQPSGRYIVECRRPDATTSPVSVLPTQALAMGAPSIWHRQRTLQGLYVDAS